MRSRAAFAVVLLLAACAGRSPGDAAVEWLWAQQQRDGAFRSPQYAALGSGQALTPFVLHALLAAGAARDQRLARGLDFVRRSVGQDGAVGYGDPDLLEYPVYATALGILVLVRNGAPEDSDRIAAMADWLGRQQCREPRGFSSDAPAYGAFGFGARGLPPGEPGHVDLSHTRYALQALAVADRLDDATRAAALVLLQRLQRPDGGFCFSPAVAAANKAGLDTAGGFRSYATATADGLLALRALGLDAADARVARAEAWLRQHAAVDRIGGIPDDAAEPWHEALRYYHAMVVADALPALRPALRAMVVPRQAADGSCRCPLVTAMKEDDPVLATALALAVLRG